MHRHRPHTCVRAHHSQPTQFLLFEYWNIVTVGWYVLRHREPNRILRSQQRARARENEKLVNKSLIFVSFGFSFIFSFFVFYSFLIIPHIPDPKCEWMCGSVYEFRRVYVYVCGVEAAEKRNMCQGVGRYYDSIAMEKDDNERKIHVYFSLEWK